MKLQVLVECYHRRLCFCSKFLNQCVERLKVFTSETPLLGFLKAPSYGVCNKCFFCIDISRGCNRSVNGYTFNRSKNLFQTWKEAGVLNVQYNLCHNT